MVAAWGRRRELAGALAAVESRRMDVLDRLADVAVPPVPAQRSFTAGVRRKLNPRLLALHVVEFALGATAWAVIHLAAALLAAVQYTVTGTWPRGRESGETRGDAR